MTEKEFQDRRARIIQRTQNLQAQLCPRCRGVQPSVQAPKPVVQASKTVQAKPEESPEAQALRDKLASLGNTPEGKKYIVYAMKEFPHKSGGLDAKQWAKAVLAGKFESP